MMQVRVLHMLTVAFLALKGQTYSRLNLNLNKSREQEFYI